MNYKGIIHPDQLAMMSKVLNEHCRERGIRSGTSRLLKNSAAFANEA